MNSGRELDALIAEHVMGWNLYQGAWFGPQLEPHGEGYKCEVNDFQPSTDIAAAWAVLDKVYPLMIDIHRRVNNEYKITVWFCDPAQESIRPQVGYSGSVESNTAPHAICLAALKAVGYEFAKQESDSEGGESDE